MQLPRQSRLPIRSLPNGAAPFGDIHEASRSVSHDQSRVDGQRLAQYVSQFTVQHENHVIILSCREESKARSFIPAKFLSQLLLRTSPFFHLWAWPAATKPRKTLPARYAWLACCYGGCYKNATPSWLACKCKNVGISHRRQSHTGGNYP